jgi:hypothetical protein
LRRANLKQKQEKFSAETKEKRKNISAKRKKYVSKGVRGGAIEEAKNGYVLATGSNPCDFIFGT